MKPSDDAALSAARERVAHADWQSAIDELHRRPIRDSAGWNYLLGFALAHQRLPDMEAALWYLDAALRIDPYHFAALRESAEIALNQRNPRAAEGLLQRLGNACELACEDYEALKRSIDAYKAKLCDSVNP